jgi:outer membrane usher protein FimD/PapC
MWHPCLKSGHLKFPVFRYSLIVTSFFLNGASQARADEWFNPAFLSHDGAPVADLARFNNNAGQAPGVYRVDIWVNDEFVMTSDMRFDISQKPPEVHMSAKNGTTDNTGLQPCLTQAWLKRLGVNPVTSATTPAPADDSACLDFIKSYPGASSRYDFPNQRLYLNFPQAALQNNIRGYIPPELWDEGINAGLLNYTFTGNRGTQDTSYFLNLNSGINVGPWRLRHNGAWNYVSNDQRSQNQWQNISTYAERTIVPLKSELVVGDSNSDGDVFDSVGFRGARLFTIDAMYPDSQRGYAPTVRGVASGRSKITVKQNGYVIYQDTVQSGAFVISDLNPTTSNGDLDVTVESETGGGVQKYTVPYSTVPLLQREGRIKYDLLAGRYRNGSAQKDTPSFMQGTLARGFAGGYTLYGGTQLAEKYTSLAAGIGQNLGSWGATSVDLTTAESELADGSHHQGQSLRFLYAKSLNNYGTNFQLLGYRYSTRGFYTLDEVAWDTMQGYQYEWQPDASGQGDVYKPVSYHDLQRSKKGRFQLSISQMLGDVGSLYLSGNKQTYWNSDGADTWYQAGFSSEWHDISYSISYSLSRNAGIGVSDRLLSLNVSVPFGRWLGHDMPEHRALNSMYSTSQASRDEDGNTQIQTGVSGTLLDDGSLSYSMMQGQTNRSGASGNVNASLRSRYGNASGGYSYNSFDRSVNWNLSGGAVAHKDGITLGQPLGDTNVLIKAPGAKGVRVENESGVKTDARGYAIVPYATVYRRNRIALDVNSLDMHTDLEGNVQSVVPTDGAIVRAEYKTHVGIRALVTPQLNGQAVRLGSVVTEKTSGVTGIVSETGQVYLSGAPAHGELEVVWGKSAAEHCHAEYQLPADRENKPVVQVAARCTQ